MQPGERRGRVGEMAQLQPPPARFAVFEGKRSVAADQRDASIAVRDQRAESAEAIDQLAHFASHPRRLGPGRPRRCQKLPVLTLVQKKANALASMLWRGGAPGGVVGSWKEVCGVKRARPSFAES